MPVMSMSFDYVLKAKFFFGFNSFVIPRSAVSVIVTRFLCYVG